MCWTVSTMQAAWPVFESQSVKDIMLPVPLSSPSCHDGIVAHEAAQTYKYVYLSLAK